MSQPQCNAGATAPMAAAGHWLAGWTPVPAAHGNPSAQDGAFIALQNAYRPHAGLLRLRRPVDGPYRRGEAWEDGVVADLVDAGALFGFPWYDALWVPMFQFDRPGLAVAAVPQRVVAEWGRHFDSWALAGWFVQPNAWLAGDRPIDCLASRLPEVLQAARADRFVAMG